MRRMRGYDRSLALSVKNAERRGLGLTEALRTVMLDPANSQFHRASAGKLLSISGDPDAVHALLNLFRGQSDKDDLYGTALTLEELNDHRAVGPLIRMLLEDDNPHRRHASARALGWIRRPGRAAALALARCLVDLNQPQAAREEAAESLAYVGNRETIEPLIPVLRDRDVRIRFWAVFGLGQSCRGDARAVQALESMLDDEEVPPGNWWPVGMEALAMLANLRPEYKTKLAAETRRILSTPDSAPEARRWVECYAR